MSDSDIEQEKEWFREFGERILGQLRHSVVDHNPGTYHAQSLIKAVSDRFLRGTEAEWAFALEAGVLQWLIKTIFEPVLGGVDEATLFEWRDNPRRYFFRIRAFVCCVHLFGTALREGHKLLLKDRAGEIYEECMPAIKTAVQLAMRYFPMFWRRMYKFRASLINETFNDLTFEAEDLRSLHSQLPLIAVSCQYLYRMFGGLEERIRPDMELTLLYLWLQKSSSPMQMWIPNWLVQSLPEDERQKEFCELALAEVTSLAAINECFQRDYARESIIDSPMEGLVRAHFVLFRGFRMNGVDVMDPVAVSSVLAACRRQLCRGTSGISTTRALGFSVSILANSFRDTFENPDNPGARLSEGLIHAIIEFLRVSFSRTDLEAVNNQEGYLISVDVILQACRTHLSLLPEIPTTRSSFAKIQRLRARRRHALQSCKDLLDDVRSRQPVDHPRLEQIVSHVIRLALELPKAPKDPNGKAFGILERCASKTCLCSVYKPPHAMRVCDGCYSVAYCGEACRQRDWGEGGHSAWCKRFDRSLDRDVLSKVEE